ncbi:MAG: T9SS type A sorting domain-containing protein [Pedobacter sp.]|nr:MAG: T9SS type A sorting domain-containing protein [Pedobacter sp.]
MNWSTASEKENLYYEVYRSVDGIRFERVGTVSGAGSTNTESKYSFNDPIDGLRGTVYYRLKDIDMDGKGTFSKIVSLNLDGRATTIDFNTYPNPFVKDLKLVVNSQREKQATILLTDVTGQKYVAKTVLVQRGQNIVVLPDLEKLSKGVYMVQVIMEGETFTQKVIKY